MHLYSKLLLTSFKRLNVHFYSQSLFVTQVLLLWKAKSWVVAYAYSAPNKTWFTHLDVARESLVCILTFSECLHAIFRGLKDSS